jgi:hypothetical protein
MSDAMAARMSYVARSRHGVTDGSGTAPAPSTTNAIRTMKTSRFSPPLRCLSLLLLGMAVLGLTTGCAGTREAKPEQRGNAVEPQTGSAETDDIALHGDNPRVTISLPDPVLEGSPDDTIMVPVRMTIAEGSRMYTDKRYPEMMFQPVPLSFTVDGDKHLEQAGPAIFDAIPVLRQDKHFEAELEYWVGSVILYIPVRIEGEEGETYDQGSIGVEFMTCDDHSCYPPETVRLPFTIVTVDDDDLVQ